MNIEIYCDVHSCKICDIDYDKNVPVYVPPCILCLGDAAKEVLEAAERRVVK
jgi:hypothetical protein